MKSIIEKVEVMKGKMTISETMNFKELVSDEKDINTMVFVLNVVPL